MINLILVNSKGKLDISQKCTTVRWSGDYKQVARRLDFGVVCDNFNISLGDKIIFGEDGIQLFEGFVFFRDKSTKDIEINITAYDKAIYLLKNKNVYNFKSITPEAIAKRICSDFNIPSGDMAVTNIRISHIFNSDTLYDIIMTSYTKAAEQNGKKYMPLMIDNKLSVIERGQLALEYTIDNDKDIMNSSYSESIENMINTIKVVDSKGNNLGIVDNKDWTKSFGTFQDVYVKEDGVDFRSVANNMLTGIEQTGSIEALGNIDCISGYSVGVKEEITGMIGIFNIDSDIHTWDNGLHTMSLELNFDEIMDEKTFRNKKKKAKSKTTEKLKWNLEW